MRIKNPALAGSPWSGHAWVAERIGDGLAPDSGTGGDVTGERVDQPSFCRICNAMCGIIVTLEGDHVVRVRGDADHPLSEGYTCPKGRALPAFHHDPRRLDRPTINGQVVEWND